MMLWGGGSILFRLEAWGTFDDEASTGGEPIVPLGLGTSFGFSVTIELGIAFNWGMSFVWETSLHFMAFFAHMLTMNVPLYKHMVVVLSS